MRPRISGNAAVAGVIGWPVSHSRSPALHNHWLARYGIDGAYVPLPVVPDQFGAALTGLRAAGFRGANVTIPHKEAAYAACTTLDDAARRSGAVNTLIFSERGIEGRNTDGAGFIANLRAHGIDPGAGPALLLGAGGAARAIAVALQDAGAQVTVTNRSPERAAALCSALPGLHALDWQSRCASLADFALLVNTTPLGMKDGAAPIALDCAPSGLAVADIVYVPLQTPLLQDAATNGLRTCGGLGMLLHQAVPGFAAWFGITPEVDSETIDLIAATIPRS